MSGFLRFVGRIFFVTLLITSAVFKIKQPKSFVTDITNGYNAIRSLHSSIGDVLPNTQIISEKIPIETVVKILGATEGLIALLIVFGDGLGGVLFLAHAVVKTVAVHGPFILAVVSNKRFNDLISLAPELAKVAIILGLALVFTASKAARKPAIKA